MSGLQIVGLIVLGLGILGLIYGGFTYTKETHDANLGPLEFEIKNQERFEIPTWSGILAVVVGGGLLVFGRGKR